MGKNNNFKFGTTVEGFDIPVVNEREVRGAAGILFLLSIISFVFAWFDHNFNLINLFVVLFLMDFAIRIFVTPRYSPTLILSRFIVRRQKPDYSGAPQKRFAAMLGLILSVILFLLFDVFSVVNWVTWFLYILGMVLFYMESVFGICVGCRLYSIFTGKPTTLCPGGVCEDW